MSHGHEKPAKQQSWNSSNDVRKRLNKEEATNAFRAGGSNKKGMKDGPRQDVKPFCIRCHRDNHVAAYCIAKRDNTGKLLEETMGTPKSDASSETDKTSKSSDPEPKLPSDKKEKAPKEPFVWISIQATMREKREVGTVRVFNMTMFYQFFLKILALPSLPFLFLWGVYKFLYSFFFDVVMDAPSSRIDYNEGKYVNYDLKDEYDRSMSNLVGCNFNYEYQVTIDYNVLTYMRKQWGSFNPTKYSHHQLYTQFNLYEPVPLDKEEIVRNTVDFMIQQQEIRNIKIARRSLVRVAEALEERHFQQEAWVGTRFILVFIVATLTLLALLAIYLFVLFDLTQMLSDIEEALMSSVETSF